MLVIPPTAWASRAGQAELYELSVAVIEAQGKAAWLELANASPKAAIFESDPTPFDADISEELLPFVLRGAAASDLPDPAAIVAIAVPALLLTWATDAGHPVSTAERLADLLPDAELHVAETIPQIRTWPERVAAFLDA